jgi:seryl-tRNA synthetase
MGKEFLENLKKAVEEGEFNSEAAKKINEIDKLADEKKDAAKSVDERLAAAGIKNINEEDGITLNSDYEKKMEVIKKIDMVNKEMATLEEIEDLVKADIGDMLLHIEEVEKTFVNEFSTNDASFIRLAWKIEEIKNKYQPVLMEYKRKE